MAYRLKPDRSARKNVRRVTRDQLESAATALATADEQSRPEAIHTARKAIKKTRALLRLTRSGFPRDVYRDEMATLRSTGRLLSGARDAHVLAQTIDTLADRYAGQLPARAFSDLRRAVTELSAAPDVSDQVAAATTALRELVERVPDWPLDDVRWSTLRQDTRRAYARGRTALARASDGSDAELMHEWRKRVKDHWYHHRLLRNTWKPVMRAHAEEADRVGGLLGDDHDLAVLAAFLQRHEAELAPLRHREEIAGLIHRRRAELQAEALALGRRLYAERPAAFGRRTGRYVKEARAERKGSSPAAA